MVSSSKKEQTSGKHSTVRYGKKIREELAQVKKQKKKKHECPSCSKKSLKRMSTGIWRCKSCGTKVTSKAYAYRPQEVQERLQVSEAEEDVEVNPDSEVNEGDD